MKKTKEQIISKIVNDLPVRDMRGKMTDAEWHGWFLECWDEAINYSRCSAELPSEEREKLIDESYFLNLQNLSGREDFEEAFKLGVMTGVDETIEYLNENKAIT